MKLQGVRVLDLSLFLPGPHLTMTMADHGAEVIKVEPYPDGEPARQAMYSKSGHSVWFRNTNRGKKSIRLNLKDQRGREILLKLCETADVLVESFRPGVMHRLGVGFQTVAARAPQIVYCSISAFGQTGSYSTKPAHDVAVQAMAGILSVNLGSDQFPALPGVAAADAIGSLVAFSGIVMALLRQRSTGKGDYLDIAMYDALLSWTPHVLGPVFAEHRAPVPEHERSWGGAAFYNVYQTKDGKFIALGGVELHFAKNFLNKAGRPDLIPLCQQPTGPAQEPVKVFLRNFFGSRTLNECKAWLADVDVAWAPVRTLYDAVFDPATTERGMLVRDKDGVEHLGVPIKFNNEPAEPDFQCPRLGEHTSEILKTIGYSDAEVVTLTREHVV